jgi:hypothetical protein
MLHLVDLVAVVVLMVNLLELVLNQLNQEIRVHMDLETQVVQVQVMMVVNLIQVEAVVLVPLDKMQGHTLQGQVV